MWEYPTDLGRAMYITAAKHRILPLRRAGAARLSPAPRGRADPAPRCAPSATVRACPERLFCPVLSAFPSVRPSSRCGERRGPDAGRAAGAAAVARTPSPWERSGGGRAAALFIGSARPSRSRPAAAALPPLGGRAQQRGSSCPVLSCPVLSTAALRAGGSSGAVTDPGRV